MTLESSEGARIMRGGTGEASAESAGARLLAKAQRLHELGKLRDRHFRRSVMADSNMGVMLSLFLAELQAVPLTGDTLALINLIDDDEGTRVVETLVHAGLAVVTGHNPERRTVGLTPLGSARMRSFISDYPDI